MLTRRESLGSRAAEAAGDREPIAYPAATTLDTWNEMIADAAPLSKLTALTRLELEPTAIVDLTPLAGLTVLDSRPQQDQCRRPLPARRLPNLITLVLTDAPAADLAPLAGVIANGFKIEGRSVPANLRRKRKRP